jgi:hypothetical protein
LFPVRQLGTDGNGGQFGNEFTTLRPGDDSFYWLTVGEIDGRCQGRVDTWYKNYSSATLTGRIDPESNEVYISTVGVKRLTLWLGRAPKGPSMIDFERPLTVGVNRKIRWPNRKVGPSLATLLEDLFQRGDRQRLFLAKMDFGI